MPLKPSLIVPGLMRGARSNVRLVKKSRGLLSVTPIGLIAYAAKSDLSKFSIRQAVLEVELVDSTMGKRLAVLVDRSPGKANEDQAAADTKAMSWKEIGRPCSSMRRASSSASWRASPGEVDYG